MRISDHRILGIVGRRRARIGDWPLAYFVNHLLDSTNSSFKFGYYYSNQNNLNQLIR